MLELQCSAVLRCTGYVTSKLVPLPFLNQGRVVSQAKPPQYMANERTIVKTNSV